MKKTSNWQIYRVNVNGKEYLYNIISGEISEIKEDEKYSKSILPCKEPYSREQLMQWKAEKGAALEKKIEFHNLALVLSQDCNMRCVYCYENGGSFNRKRKIMDVDSIKKSIDWWIDALPISVSEANIEFYGGEPLLNEKGFVFAVSYLNEISGKRKININYLITTNGTLINQSTSKVMARNKIAVMISIDGNKTAHNRNRKLIGNRDSYDIVIKNIHMLLKEGVKVSARITLTRNNISELYESVLALWDEGISIIDCVPVLTEQESLRIGIEDLSGLAENYAKIEEALADKLLNGEKYYFNSFLRIIYALYLRLDKYYPTCGYYSCKKIYCTPEGEVYNCEKLIGKTGEKIGDIGIINNSVLKNRLLGHIYQDECSKCLLRRVCGGQCYADAMNHREYMKIICQIQKMQFESAFRIYIKMRQYDEQFWDTFYGRS